MQILTRLETRDKVQIVALISLGHFLGIYQFVYDLVKTAGYELCVTFGLGFLFCVALSFGFKGILFLMDILDGYAEAVLKRFSGSSGSEKPIGHIFYEGKWRAVLPIKEKPKVKNIFMKWIKSCYTKFENKINPKPYIDLRCYGYKDDSDSDTEY